MLITLDRRTDWTGRPALACDPLTGAVTGPALRSELRRLCATTGTHGPAASLTLLSVGLDDFTQVNAAHGPETGDAVLVEVVKRLIGLALPGDVVARVGGDEFVLMAVGRTFQQIEELEPRVLAALAYPVRVNEITVRLSASVGRGWARDGMTAEQLLDTADQDMHFAKTLRKTRRLSRTG
ncbi:GGDEF domain-containing protein [Streptomyces sp. NPDC002758]